MATQSWLITGGAGYIGAHVADAFLSSGKDVVIYDPLHHGLKSRIEYLSQKFNKDIPLIVADIRDTKAFIRTLERYKPYGVVHSAALKSVGESMIKPDEYFDVNFHATTKMLEIMSAQFIHHFIFSSTAAVYGSPDHSIAIKEIDEKNPISPYGASKLAAEGEVAKFLTIPRNHGTSLRFFNVVGTAAFELMDNSTENLVPIVIKNLNTGQPPVIYGTDYPTPDGTCIRDYVDVRDIARAHVIAADAINPLPLAINVGTGRGASVREVINLVCEAAKRTEVIATKANRRTGDSAFLCADTSLIKSSIGFEARYSLEESVESLF